MTPHGAVLGRAALLARLAAAPPLVEGLVDVEQQVQPHGIDLRLDTIWRFADAGRLGRDRPAADSARGSSISPGGRLLQPMSAPPAGAGQAEGDRRLPEREALPWDADGGLHLVAGAYLVRFIEIVHLPLDVMALGRPRSTLLRCGATLHTAVWDAGYSGRSEALLVVANPHGVRLDRAARVCQLIFLLLDALGPGYEGVYQAENLR